MPNDVSYFKVPGDSNTYQFNDQDAESGLAAETARAEAAEQANADAISAEASRAAGVEGTLSNLTTTAKGNLVAAINEVDANTDANTASISSLNSKFTVATVTGTLTLATPISTATALRIATLNISSYIPSGYTFHSVRRSYVGGSVNACVNDSGTRLMFIVIAGSSVTTIDVTVEINLVKTS